MSRSYHNMHWDSDDDHPRKKQIPPKRTEKKEVRIQRAKKWEWERYIDTRNDEREIAFQVAQIISHSLQVLYDDSLRDRFRAEKATELRSMISQKQIPRNQRPLPEYRKKKLSRDDIKKEVEIALAWIMKESWEEEKKLRSIEICYNQHCST